jgi:hypothetical protein
MAFELKANPQFVEPLLTNLRTLITNYWRDCVEALYPAADYPTALDDYPPFAMIEFARRYEVEYPFLAITPRRSNVPEGADGDLIDGQHGILLEFVVKHPNSRDCVIRGMRYARILHCLIASVTIAEMASGIDTDARGGVFWEVTDHDYLPLRRISNVPDRYTGNPSGDPAWNDGEDEDRPYVQIVQLALSVRLWERFYSAG